MKNKKYVEALWECYQKGVAEEGVEEKDLFLHLIDDAINQIIEKRGGDSDQLDAMVRCEQCVEKNLKRSDVKEYRATTPEGDQANLTLCKPCVNYLRHEENVRLKLISTQYQV